MLGLAAPVANSVLNAVLRGIPYSGPSSVFIQLHVGRPGATGTSNVAGNNLRQSVAFAASSRGTIVTAGDVTWTSVPVSEQYTHFSLWDTAGTFVLSGSIDVQPITSGDTFVIGAGAEVGNLSVAS